MALVKERNKLRKAASPAIPHELVYETLADGTPVYYNGYKEYLKGNKTAEALIGSSYLQGMIISVILRYLFKNLSESYEVLINKLGLQYSKKGWRASEHCHI
jgi:hypothetical protein